MAAILQVYAGSLNFMNLRKQHLFSKRKGKYFYTFNHFCSEKSSKRSKITQIYYYEPQSESTPRRLTLHLVTDLSLASYSPFELWSLYNFHISIFFTFQLPMFFIFTMNFFVLITVQHNCQMTMYLCLDYGRIGLNWKTIANHYSLISDIPHMHHSKILKDGWGKIHSQFCF